MEVIDEKILRKAREVNQRHTQADEGLHSNHKFVIGQMFSMHNVSADEQATSSPLLQIRLYL